MIRSFMPLDVFDLLVRGKALSNKAKTRDSVGRKDARVGDLVNIVGDWFNPQLRPCAWVFSEGFSLRGLTSVRDRHGSHAWEINRLLVADQDSNCCVRLLEHLGSVGGQLEIERIFLRLPAESPLLKAAQETGFLPYSREHLYWLEKPDGGPGRTRKSPAHPLRRKKGDDEYRLFELYLKNAPPHVRRAEGMTYKEWQSNRGRSAGQEWVLEKDGSIVGWVAVNTGGNWGQLDMVAETADELQSVVEYGLATLGERQRVCCLAPDFDGALVRLLESQGFRRVMTYSLLTRELVVRVAERFVMPAVPA